MHARFNQEGYFVIAPRNETEQYALKVWAKNTRTDDTINETCGLIVLDTIETDKSPFGLHMNIHGFLTITPQDEMQSYLLSDWMRRFKTNQSKLINLAVRIDAASPY